MVGDSLRRVGMKAVLTGGAAATVWASEAIQSYDCDFVVEFRCPGDAFRRAMSSLGYRLDGGTYRHETSPVTLEFLNGPVMIGDEEITEWATLSEGGRTLDLLTRTDSCKDRLASFYHWKDYSGLRQAILVARSGKVDLRAVERWSEAEGAKESWGEFLFHLRREERM